MAELGLEPSSICFSYAQVRKGTPGGRVTQGAGRPAVPEPESEEFVLFFKFFFRAGSWTLCRRSHPHLLPASAPPPQALSCTSEPGLGSGWGLGAPGGGASREAGATGLDDRHQKPSLNKGWVGGGLVCPHPPSQRVLSQDHSQQGGRAWPGPWPSCCPSFCSSRARHWPQEPAEVSWGAEGLGAARWDLTSCSAQSEGTAGPGGSLPPWALPWGVFASPPA